MNHLPDTTTFSLMMHKAEDLVRSTEHLLLQQPIPDTNTFLYQHVRLPYFLAYLTSAMQQHIIANLLSQKKNPDFTNTSKNKKLTKFRTENV